MSDNPTFTGTLTWPALTDEALDRAVDAWFTSQGTVPLLDDVDEHWRGRMRAAINALRGAA